MRHDKKTRKKALELYERGSSCDKISRNPDMPTRETIRRWVQDAGITREKKQIYPRKKIAAMLERGVARSKIQEEYGCSAKFLSQLANGQLTP